MNRFIVAAMAALITGPATAESSMYGCQCSLPAQQVYSLPRAATSLVGIAGAQANTPYNLNPVSSQRQRQITAMVDRARRDNAIKADAGEKPAHTITSVYARVRNANGSYSASRQTGWNVDGKSYPTFTAEERGTGWMGGYR